LIVVWSAFTSFAADITIDATVGNDLRTITGTMRWTGDEPLVDPLALLPDPPPDDQIERRTWPGRPSRGEVTFGEPVDGVVEFRALLPHRYGAIGWSSHGLFASGGWYPQPDGLPVAHWTVSVTLPEGTTGALGSTVGTGTLTWEGGGERVPLAVVKHGRVTLLQGNEVDLDLLTRGAPRGKFAKELLRVANTLDWPLEGVVVETPLRRRLVQPAPGLLYISDRAFRVTEGLRWIHRDAVARALATAVVSPADPAERARRADKLADLSAEELSTGRAYRLADSLRWVPVFDRILTTERMAFYHDIFGVGPGDRVREDLLEVFGPPPPVEPDVVRRNYWITFALRINSINLSEGEIIFGAEFTMRRAEDTHNLGTLRFSNSLTDASIVEVQYLRKQGPLLDATNRPHRLRFDAGLSFLNQNFAPTDEGLASDLGFSHNYDDRLPSQFPLKGKRAGVDVGYGGFVGTDQHWTSVHGSAVGVVSPDPRLAFAGRGSLGFADSDIPHRLLLLGGDDVMRSIPTLPACPAVDDNGDPIPCTDVATERAHAAVELRCAIIRGWSVPFLLAWGSEVQLALGVEGLAARLVGGDPAHAMGLTAGIVGAGDVLGVQELTLGLTAAWLLPVENIDGVDPTGVPEIYLRAGQAF